jgi:hypothetical protein
MMQPCASAAKLLDEGPFFKRGLRAIVLFGSPSPRIQFGNAYAAIAGRMGFWVRCRTLVLMPRLAGRHLQGVYRSW